LAARKHITVVAWDMGHNAVGRPFFEADLLRRRYEVTLIGPNFPAFGDGIWRPIRASEVPMRTFPGTDLPEYVRLAEQALEGFETDVVIACKPRFPALLIAILLRRSLGVPVIADLDEWELSWAGANDGLTLDEVEQLRSERELEPPYGPVWTRAAEELIGDADAVTVASPVLQEIYGGTIVPQARDELAFDPARYDREAVRAEYGYTAEDRVVLFLGTPRRFKGILELAQALEQLGDPRYKLCVIGSLADPADRIELARVAAARTQLVEYQPVSEVPRLTLIGDLVCLLQDPTHMTTQHQLPAKLTEVLAMSVPVLARETPPLQPLVDAGLISGIGDVPVAARISELFSDPDGMQAQAQRARRFFLDELSYSATLEILDGVFDRLENGRLELPPNWARAYHLASSIPRRPQPGAAGTDPPPSADTQAPRGAPRARGPARTVEIIGNEFIQGRVEQIRDGVVSGWAWNPAAPGWRVGVRALVDGQDVAGAVAHLERPSLAGRVGDGRHGFRIRLPANVAREGEHSLRIEAAGARLPPAASFDVVPAEGSAPWAGVQFSLEEAILGRIDRVCDGVVSGWACKPAELDRRAELRALVDGVELATGRADLDRPDLAEAGLGDGRYGFRIALPAGTVAGPGRVLRVETAGGVPIPASASFTTATERDGGLWGGPELRVQAAVLGCVEEVSDAIVSGWALRPDAPAWRVWVQVTVDGVEACSGVADLDRPELAVRGIGDSRHGFRFELPTAPPHTDRRRVLIQAEGVALKPTALPQASRFPRARVIEWPCPGVVNLLEDAVLDRPGADDVVVDIALSVTSTGTELARFRSLPNAVVTYPHRPGFMAAGAVAVGSPSLEPGDEVAVRQVPHQTPVVVRRTDVHAIPPGVELVDGALWHLGLVALYGLRLGGYVRGEALAVVGSGIVGAIVRRLALAMGTSECLIVAASDAKRWTCAREQGSRFLALNKSSLETERGRYPLTIDATGAAAGLETGVALTAAQGRVVLLGSPRSESSALPVHAMQERGIRVTGAHIGTLKRFGSEHGVAVAEELTETFFSLLATGVSFADLIERHSPAEARHVYEVAAQEPSFVAAAFDWSGGD
jgi:NADPH:quinone reductase-like Zn-dependent oxidoreductase/glycosyltransferase involved in cell wall biosynthesis